MLQIIQQIAVGVSRKMPVRAGDDCPNNVPSAPG
jgi:hypothetical protein